VDWRTGRELSMKFATAQKPHEPGNHRTVPFVAFYGDPRKPRNKAI